MISFNKTTRLSLLLTMVIGLSACGSIDKKVSSHALTTNISGLVLDKSAAPTVLYTRPNAPGLGGYDSFIINPVRISYRDPSMAKISPNDLSKMQRYFRDSVSKELSDAGYRVTNQPNVGTMRITFTLSGIKAPNAVANIVGVLAPVALSVGEVTVEAAFSDSATNRIDAVAINRAQGSRVLNTTPWSTWADIEASFDDWAAGIADAVKKAHGLKRR